VKFTSTTAKTVIGAAGIAAVGLFGAAGSSAAPTITEGLGTPETLVDGPLVTAYTVSDLQPATVTIPGYTPKGKLWQADVNVQANSGVVTPVVSNFNARAGEQNYRVISAPATPQGVSPAPITQGAATSGKLYFDVTGPAPTSVVYNDGVQDVLVWESNPASAPAPNTLPGQANPGQTMPGQTNPVPGEMPNPGTSPAPGMTPNSPAHT
jgi:Domain of unknown function (DUF1942)